MKQTEILTHASCNSCKRLGILTHATHVNGWFPAVYMSCMSQNFRLFHVSNLSVRNFRIFLLIYTGLVITPPRRLARRSVAGCDWCVLFQLLNSLARDLDHMLNDLCHDPEAGRTGNNKNNNLQARSVPERPTCGPFRASGYGVNHVVCCCTKHPVLMPFSKSLAANTFFAYQCES